VRVFREPIGDVVDYIVNLITKAEEHLIEAKSDEKVKEPLNSGRISTSIAKAIKAKVLVWAASPLFNGNEFYSTFKDSRGRQLIPSGAPDLAKWDRAAKACKEAIDWIETGAPNAPSHRLYTISKVQGVSPQTDLKYKLRYAVTEPFNDEIIWPSTHPTTGFNGRGLQDRLWQMNLARESMPTFLTLATGTHSGAIGTTLNMAEQFYTFNGLPLEDDKTWKEFAGGLERRYDTRQVGAADTLLPFNHKYYLKQSAVTAQLNFRREPRFYAYLGFDGGIWEGAQQAEKESFVVDRGSDLLKENVPTGYYMKKVVKPDSYFSITGTAYSVMSEPYTFPYMRLSELYLLYAEALNETVGDDGVPPSDVYKYVNLVRERAGLPTTVEQAWGNSDICESKSVNLHTKGKGMREIIRRERTIELCFEGKRGEDVRRWRIAHDEFSKPILGWNGPYQTTSENYYRVVPYSSRTFTQRDYLWPIKSSNIDINNNLKQNPGW
jgi:hypothetical protein